MVAESWFEVYSTESHLWNMSGPDTTEHYWALQRTHQMSDWAIFRGGADTAAGLSGLVSGRWDNSLSAQMWLYASISLMVMAG